MNSTQDVQNLLIAEPVPQQLQGLYSNWLLLRGSAAIVTAQPYFNLTLLPTLPEDQAVVRAHASDYENEESGELLAVFQAFVTLSNAFQNFGAQLLPVARRLDAGPHGDPSFAADMTLFDELLAELKNLVASPSAEHASSTYNVVNAARGTLAAFYNEKMEDDVARFQTALKEAKESGTMEALKAEIASLQQQMDGLNQEISMGAVSEIPEALAFGMSMGEAAVAELPVGMVVVNMAIQISNEAMAGSRFEKEWKERYDKLGALAAQYRQKLVELASDQQQMAVLQTLASQVGAMGDKVQAARKELASITAALSQLVNGFGELIAMDVEPSAGYFESQVTGAMQFWSDLGSACQKYLQSAVSV